MIPWISLERSDQIDEIIRISHEKPVIIFKHSSRCSISSIAKMRLEDQWNFAPANLQCYFLDLISNRNASDQVSEQLEVHHESPQLILILNGECIYDASHFDISINDVNESLDYSYSNS